MKHKKTILFVAVSMGLVALLYKPHKNQLDVIDVNNKNPSGIDSASKLINATNAVARDAGAQATFTNIFPTRTGDLTTQFFNPTQTTDLVVDKVFVIETEEDFLKNYSLAVYVPNRLKAAEVAVQQALPPVPLPPPAQPLIHSANGTGGMTTYNYNTNMFSTNPNGFSSSVLGSGRGF